MIRSVALDRAISCIEEVANDLNGSRHSKKLRYVVNLLNEKTVDFDAAVVRGLESIRNEM